MTRSIPWYGLVGGVLVGMLVLAGCRAVDPAGTAPDPERLSMGSAAFDLLTHSGGYHHRQHTLSVAEESLVRRCMTAKGLVYEPLTPAPARSDEERALGLDRRRTEGYGLYESLTADPAARERSPSPVDRYIARLPAQDRADYMLALFGDERQRRGIRLYRSGEVTFPASGCVFESQTRLYGDIVTWARITYLPEDLNNVLTAQVTDEPEYADATHAWSTCMAGRGHPHPRPDAARDAIAARYAAEGPGERLRTDEIAVAVADAECARDAGIPALVLTLKHRGLGTLTVEERRALVDLSESWLRAVDVAADVVRADPS
jgi:hypothetical protein